MAHPLAVTPVTTPLAEGRLVNLTLEGQYSTPTPPDAYAYLGAPVFDYAGRSVAASGREVLEVTSHLPASNAAFADFFGQPGTPITTPDFFINQQGKRQVADLTFFYDDINDFIFFSPLGDDVDGEVVTETLADFFTSTSALIPVDFFPAPLTGVTWLTWGDNDYTLQQLNEAGLTFTVLS